MWTSFVFLLFVSVTIAWNDNSPWKPNTQYQYDIHVRTFSGIPKLRNQYAGVVSRGKLTIQSGQKPNVIVGQLSEMKDGSYHGDLENKFHAEIPSGAAIDYNQSPLNGKSFRLNLKKGIVESIEVDRSMTNDQVNQLKGILSQLQMDLEGQNLIESPHNHLPLRMEPSGYYRTMEASVTGECETIYEISPLADYQVSDSFPHWTLDPEAIASGSVPFQIIKTMNYSNCEHSRGYQHGIEGTYGYFGTQSNKMGDLFSKLTTSRMIVSGHQDHATLHYAATINRIAASPEMHQKQNAMVVSIVELVLVESQEYSGQSLEPENPLNAGSLVYRYNIGTDAENTVRDGTDDVSYARYGKSQYNRHPQPWDDELSSSSYKYGRKYSRSGSNANTHSWRQDKFWLPAPQIDQPASNPFAPYSIGHQGHGIQHEVKIIDEIEKLVNEIARDLQDRGHIADKNSLEKYKIVVDLIAQANFEEIQAVDAKLQAKGNNNSNQNVWMIFRDAIAAVGSGPTTKLVAEWLVSGRLQGAGAAHVLANQPKSIRTPTAGHIAAFLTIVKSPRVVKDQHVHTAAVFALAELVERSYFNRATRHSYYPTESYGPFYQKLDSIVRNQVIPYFETGLQAALSNDRQVLVFLRAFGNLGSQSYLKSFKKHFESPKDLTTYQRTAAVLALDRLTRNNPDLVRPVLQKIYENVAEVPETRAIAVLLLIESDPPVDLLQRIASFTNQDPSQQVQSIVQASIESVARLQNPADLERASRAESARQFLNPHHYPNGYSRYHLIEYFVDALNYDHQVGASYLAGRDSAVPRMLRYRSYHNRGGYLSSGLEVEAMLSSVRELMQRFVWPNRSSSSMEWNHSEQSESPKTGSDWYSLKSERKNPFFAAQSDDSEDGPEWRSNPEQLNRWNEIWYGGRMKRDYEHKGKPANSRLFRRREAEASIQRGTEDRFEAQIYHELFGGHQFYAFDKQSIQNLPKLAAEVIGSYSNGRKINYNKLYNAASLMISFPLATGYPYIYTYDNPVLVQASGNVRIQVHPKLSAQAAFVSIPKTTNITAQVHLVYSRDHITRSGFMTTQNGQSYMAGHVRKTMYHAPLNLEVNVDVPNRQFDAEISPADPKHVTTLAHFSSWPYTVQHDSFSLRPDAENPGKKIIHVRQPERINKRYGENSTGMVFHVQGKYESRNVGQNQNGPLPYIIGNRKQNLMKSLFLPVEGLEQYSVDIRHDGKRSASSTVKFGFSYKSVSVASKTNAGGEKPMLEKYSGVLLAQPAVQNAWLQAAASKFPKAISTVANAWVTFEGPEATQAIYEVMGAYGRTPSHDSGQLITTVRTYQLPRNNEHYYCLTAQAQNSGDENLARSSLSWAKKVDHTSSLHFKLVADSHCNEDSAGVHGVVAFGQSVHYSNYVAGSPEAQRCEAEMRDGNYQMPACQHAIHMARHRNVLMFQMQQQGSHQTGQDSKWFNWLERSIRMRYDNAVVTKSDSSSEFVGGNNVIAGLLEMPYGSNSYNGTIHYRDNTYEVSQLQSNPWLRNIFLYRRIRLAYIPYIEPIASAPSTCVVDRSQILTYDQRVLNHSIGNCGYVVTVYSPPQYQSDPNYKATKANPDRAIMVLVSDEAGTPYSRAVAIHVADHSGAIHSLGLVGRGAGLRPSVYWTKYASGSDPKPQLVSPSEDFLVNDQGAPRLAVYGANERDANVVVVDIHGGKMLIHFDGERVKVEAAPSYLNQLRGLCGSNDQEKYTDLVSPTNVVYRDPKYFVSSWSMYDEESCSAQVKQQQKEGQQAESHPIEYIRSAVVNGYEASSGRPYVGQSSEVSREQDDQSYEKQSSSDAGNSVRKNSSEEH